MKSARSSSPLVSGRDGNAAPRLGPAGTNTPTAIDAAAEWWVDWTVANVEAALGARPVAAALSGYVHDGMEFVTCDLDGEAGVSYGITMVIAGELRLCPGDPDVVDAVSALSLAGRLLARWSLPATIGGLVAAQ